VLLHHVNVELLRAAFFWLKRNAAPGVDGLTWHEYARNLEARLVDLHARVHRGAYRALPSRRSFIQREDGRQRPLRVAALEDKILQRAGGGGAQCNLRGGFPGVLLRVPTRAQPTRCVGRARIRDHPHEGELHFGLRRQIVPRASAAEQDTSPATNHYAQHCAGAGQLPETRIRLLAHPDHHQCA
jgi:hypothetical protein